MNVAVAPLLTTGLTGVIVPLTAVVVTVQFGAGAMLNVGKVSNVPELLSTTLICPVNGPAVVGVPDMVSVAKLGAPLGTALKPAGTLVIGQVKGGATPLAVQT